MVVVLALVVVAATVVVARVVLAGPSAPPALPAPVAAVAGSWPGSVQVPQSLPACLVYTPRGSAIAPNDSAQGGSALLIRLSAAGRPECAGWNDADILIEEAPALSSLSGRVTTVTANRLQFARVEEPTGSGRRLTLQWRCHDEMCRLSGDVGGAATEDALTALAASLQPAQR